MNNDILQLHIEPNRNIGSLSSINQEHALIALSSEARSLTTARVRIRAGACEIIASDLGFWRWFSTGAPISSTTYNCLVKTAAIWQKKVTIIEVPNSRFDYPE